MWFIKLIVPLVLFTCLSDAADPGSQDPILVHIAYGASADQMSVTWSTVLDTSESVVTFGTSPRLLRNITRGSSTAFVDHGSERRKQFVHRVLLTGLGSGVKYFYRCGSGSKMSELYTFTAMKHGNTWSPRFAVFGDFGTTNAQSLDALIKETYLGHFDAILHDGDMAYNMYNDQGRNGDRFLRNIQPIAANLPYMVTVGNHEEYDNYSNYKNMFSMPGNTQAMFYSYNVGPVHIISISTEFYYFYNETDTQIANQHRWLENDLITANKNRYKQPWIILLGHKPMYCDDDLDKLIANNSYCKILRDSKYGLEDLLFDYDVDLAFWAHEHLYKRFWPIYKFKLYMGDYKDPYKNPKVPVQIVTGSAGCDERISHDDRDLPYWVAAKNLDYGYTRMTVHNATHLQLQQVSDDQYGAVIDETWLVQFVHGPRRRFKIKHRQP